MRKIAAVLIVSLAGASIAEARPLTLAMPCAQAAATVAQFGAVVMSTGPHTYNRFVVHSGFCMHGEYAKPAAAPTLDAPYCPIGYTCEYRPRFRHD